MGGDRVDVSVLTPVLNEEAHLREVAHAMLAQRFEGQIEFLFIDGGSSDATVPIIEELAAADSRIRLLHNPRGHTPAALNLALEVTRGHYIARMDAHTLYSENYIAAGVARLRQGGVDHVSGPVLSQGYDSGSRRLALVLRSRLGVGGASFRRATEETDVDTGFAGIWERSLLVELGGWDEGAVLNQDAELAARLREAGKRLVAIPEMAAVYLPRNTLRKLGRQYFRYGLYRARTTRLHPSSMRRSHVLPPGLVVTAIAAVLGPSPTRGLARAGLAVYGAATVAESVRLVATNEDASPGDVIVLPAAFATMHLCWGVGFPLGLVHFRSADTPDLKSETISRAARSAL